MEPITITWMMSTLLGGWLGNRTDYWLCQGTNKLFDRIKTNINEPANHHIQRAIRKSYLQATLMVINHIFPQRKWYKLSDARWGNIKKLESYIKEQRDLIANEKSYSRKSALDESHREILFPKNWASADRMEELVSNLKTSIIWELEGNQRKVEQAVKSCILDGWKEGSRQMDFYKLTCAFFTQELKENPELSSYIQTEYLDTIQTEIGEVKITITALSQTLNKFFEEYKDMVLLLGEIYSTLEEVKTDLGELPEKTANLVLQGIKDRAITPRQIAVSDEYQKYILDIQEYTKVIQSIVSQIEGVQIAITKVDESTKLILQRNLENLEKQLLQKSENKNRLENTLSTFVSNVIQLAKQLRQTTSLDSERLLKARALFEEGKYQELNNVLNEEDIDRDIAQYEENGKILAKELTIKAQTSVLTKKDGWFEEAYRLYAKAMRVIENYDTTFNYAYFLHEHRQILKAADIYKKALKYTSDEAKKATILNNLGILQYAKNEFEKAEYSYQKALEIRRKLSDVTLQTYLPDVGMTLNNLGILQSAKNEFEKAENFYHEALEIYRKLSDVKSQTYLPYVATTLNNLAVLQRAKNEFEKAEHSYQEALEIRRKLSDVNPQTYLPYVATTLNNLGILQSAKNEFEKAKHSYQEALEIRRKLSDVNPQTYLPYVATTLNNLGILQSAKNEFEKAEHSYQEALEIRRKLADVNPQTYLPDLAETLNNLGLLQYDKNEFKKSEHSYQEALEISRKLSDVNLQTYLPYVATILNNLADLQCNKNEFEKAEHSYQEALEIRRKLAGINPRKYEIPLADSFISLGILYKKSFKDKEKSKANAQEAIAHYSKYWNAVPHAEKWGKVAKDILAYWENG